MPSSRFYFKKCCYRYVFYWPSKYQPVRESGLNLNVSSFIAVSFAAVCPYICLSPYIYTYLLLSSKQDQVTIKNRRKKEKQNQ